MSAVFRTPGLPLSASFVTSVQAAFSHVHLRSSQKLPLPERAMPSEDSQLVSCSFKLAR